MAFCVSANGAPKPAPGGRPTAAKQVPAKSGHHFLWKVLNIPQPFYILGSVHALRSKDYPLPKEIDRAVKECRQFVFELDPPDELRKQGYRKKLREAARYPSGVTIKQKVRPETYAYLQKIARGRPAEWNTVKPWAIAMYLYGNTKGQDIYSGIGVESYVHRKAPRIGSRFAGLETADERLAVFKGMTDIESEIFLLQTLVYSDQIIARFGEITDAWKRGDKAKILQIYAAQDQEAPTITARLVDWRNIAWIPKIEQHIKSGKPTMIVGSPAPLRAQQCHLTAGETGLHA